MKFFTKNPNKKKLFFFGGGGGGGLRIQIEKKISFRG